MKRQELIKAASAKCGVSHGSDWLRCKNKELESFVEGDGDCPLCSGHVTTQAANNVPGADLAQIIAQAVSGHVKAGVDESVVNAMIDRKLEHVMEGVAKFVQDRAPREVVIKAPGKDDIKLSGKMHKAFDECLQLVACRMNLYLVGPAGSGKTTLAEQIAEALQLPHYAMSVGLQTSTASFVGYTDAHGNYVKTLWRKAYEEGGVFLIDEIDSGNSNVLTCINAATANNFCAFPDGMVKKHPDFICIAAANTYGKGQDRIYVGRNQLDGATLDRFIPVELDYDEKLERELAIGICPGAGAWVDMVHEYRKRAANNKLRVIISPRASINGAKLLNAGFDITRLEEILIFKGCTSEERSKIRG